MEHSFVENLKLIGDRFVCNIAQPENSPSGIFFVNRDPRKMKTKPDVYVGRVEEVGPGCRFVRPGQKISLRRWVYGQHDLDDERIVAKESQILMLGDRTPYPGVVAMQVILDEPKTGLIIPDTVKDRQKRPSAYRGTVIVSGVPDFKENDLIWVARRDEGQYFLGKNILIFKNEPDRLNGEKPVLMVAEKIPMLSVV